MIEKGLFQLIQSDANIAKLVNTNNGAGVYWVLMPKGAAVPCIVLSRTATQDTLTMQGATALRGALIQLDCYGANYYSARSLSTVARQLIESFKGTLPDGTVMKGALITKDWDMPYEEGGTGFVFRAMLEFRLWYIES
jgi:hypothetical protein